MMRPLLLRVCLLFALLAATAAGAAEITTDKEEVVKNAEIVGITAKQITYKAGGKEVTRPITEILRVDYRDPVKVPFGTRYAQVDLTDGTTLLVKRWAIKKGNKLEMTLLSGPEVTLPLASVNGILGRGDVEKDRNDWRNRVINTRGKSALVIKNRVMRKEGKDKNAKDVPAVDDNGNPVFTIFNVLATIGEPDDAGETLELVLEGEKKLKAKQSEIHGLIFKHTLDPKAAPVVCKLLDTAMNVVMVSKIEGKDGGGVSVTTPSGATLAFGPKEIAQLDYTKGRLDFLSVLSPEKTVITPNPFDDQGPTGKWYVYRDSNLNGTPIRLGGTSYRQGLTILPDVEMTWELGGAYRQLEAVVGIDDETKAEGEVTVTITADNKELQKIPIVSRTTRGKNGEPVAPVRRAEKVALNLKDVTTLKISVKAKDELSGLSIGVSLGDAKISK